MQSQTSSAHDIDDWQHILWQPFTNEDTLMVGKVVRFLACSHVEWTLHHTGDRLLVAYRKLGESDEKRLSYMLRPV